jgi:hypothetical protein
VTQPQRAPGPGLSAAEMGQLLSQANEAHLALAAAEQRLAEAKQAQVSVAEAVRQGAAVTAPGAAGARAEAERAQQQGLSKLSAEQVRRTAEAERLRKATAEAARSQSAVESAQAAGQHTGGPRTADEVIAARSGRKLESLNRQLDTARARWVTAPETAPARLRPVLQRAQDAADHMHVMASEFAARGDGATAGVYHRLADEVPTTLAQLREANVNATHMIGEKPFAKEGFTGTKASPLVGTKTVGAMHLRSISGPRRICWWRPSRGSWPAPISTVVCRVSRSRM